MALGKTERVAGHKVSAKKIGPRERVAIGALIGSGHLRKSDACKIVIFHGKGGKVTAVQRCEGNKLKGHGAKARAKHMDRTAKGRFKR